MLYADVYVTTKKGFNTYMPRVFSNILYNFFKLLKKTKLTKTETKSG